MVEREVVDFGFFWAIVAAGLALIFRLPIIQVASLVSIYRPLTSCCEIQVGCRCLGTWVLQRRSFLRAFRRSLTIIT